MDIGFYQFWEAGIWVLKIVLGVGLFLLPMVLLVFVIAIIATVFGSLVKDPTPPESKER